MSLWIDFAYEIGLYIYIRVLKLLKMSRVYPASNIFYQPLEGFHQVVTANRRNWIQGPVVSLNLGEAERLLNLVTG